MNGKGKNDTIKLLIFENLKKFMPDSKLEDNLKVLTKIRKNPKASQRDLALELGFSLGKLNYCLKALKKKGLLKFQNFQKQSEKVVYLRYVITPKGISERTKLTINFMKKKMKEYDELKKDLKIK